MSRSYHIQIKSINPKTWRKAGIDPFRNSLGLLPSGPDPVGERNVRASLPEVLFVPSPRHMQA